MIFRLIAFRTLSLVGLSVAAAIVVDDLRPTPAFCGLRSGCDAVVHSAFGRPLGMPLSALGLALFGAFYALTLSAHGQAARFISAGALIAGAIGVALIGVQLFLLKQICPLCLIIDAVALLLAAVELGLGQSTDAAATARPRRGAWAVAAMIALAAPVAWSFVRPPPEVPPQVKDLWVAGKINIVEITDFACPYCRRTHAALAEFIKENGEYVHFTRVVAPLKQHVDARPAARAYICAGRQGLGESMAAALFSADDLSTADCRRLAVEAGLDMIAYDRALADPRLDEISDDTIRWVEQAALGGLPQIWIESTLLVGEQTTASLQAALNRVRRRSEYKTMAALGTAMLERRRNLDSRFPSAIPSDRHGTYPSRQTRPIASFRPMETMEWK